MNHNIVSVNKVFSDGAHNAFTDIIYWNDEYYLAFRRSTEHHQIGLGNIVVLKSKTPSEQDTWKQVATIDSGLDDRDPKFFTDRDRLGIVFGSYVPRYESKSGSIANADHDIVSSVVITHNGTVWTRPFQISRLNYWMWSIVELEDETSEYLADVFGLTKLPSWISASYHPHIYNDPYSAVYFHLSDEYHRWPTFDGIHTYMSGQSISEPACMIVGKGENARLKCIVRAEALNRKVSGIVKSILIDYPFSDIESKKSITNKSMKSLDFELHSPCILARGDDTLIAGRIVYRDESKHKTFQSSKVSMFEAKTVFCFSDMKMIELPSGGDNGYPGMAMNPEKSKLYISYYSQHEVEEDKRRLVPIKSDIYIATVDLV